MTTLPYAAKRTARSLFIRLRGLRSHVLMWGDASHVSAQSPPLIMLHGWMDVAASFQFLIDALARERCVIAPDWRGFGLSDAAPSDGYWFPDYLADLDALVDTPGLGLKPGAEVDLLGHSMGGNVAMMYAGIRPLRVRRLINLEGFGLPDQAPALAPTRYAQWLDELQQTPSLRDYDSLDAVAQRLCGNNPLLSADKATWLASHWSRRAADGRWHLLADAHHKRINPVLYRAEEVLACWRRIRAPLLWVEGDRTEVFARWAQRYSRSEFDARLACVAQVERVLLSPAGHMLHHDQPEALARSIDGFLAG
jgi:pimeloyl-ACP methyl ester carboxylesterase